MTALRRAFLASAVLWAIALPLATFAAADAGGATLPYSFAFVVYGFGHVICHQLPERSFRLWGWQMPVCARCAGIYLGAAVAAVVASARPRSGAGGRSARSARTALAIASAPALATLVYEWTTGQMPANWIRAATGVVLGAVVAWLVVEVD